MAVLTNLSKEKLYDILSSAEAKLESILSDEPFNVRIGRSIGGWRSDLYEAYMPWRQKMSDTPDYVVFSVPLDLNSPLVPLSSPDLKEIVNYLAASELLGQNSSIFVPRVIGHFTLAEVPERDRRVEGFVLEYVPSSSPSQLDSISEEEYFEHLGRDVARFLINGMINVPRHLRPDYNGYSFRTAMIDLDPYDARVFRWNTIPETAFDASLLEDSEKSFVFNTFVYFVPDAYFLNRTLRPRINYLQDAYLSAFTSETERLLGSSYKPSYTKYVSINR